MDSQDWRERKSCFDESPGTHLTISALAKKSHWAAACSSRESSSWIKEKTGKGALQALQCQRGGSRLLGRLLHPVPGARTRRLLGTSLQQQQKKSCSKNLRLVRTCPAPLEEGWASGGHRTPTTKEPVTGSGGSAGAAQHPGEAQPRQRGKQHRQPGSPGAPASGTGTSGAGGRGHGKQSGGPVPAQPPLPSAPRARPRDSVTY